MKYIKKNVVFSPENEADMELYKQLQALPYGEFTSRTKELWRKELQKEEQAKHIPLKVVNDPPTVKAEMHHRFAGGTIGDFEDKNQVTLGLDGKLRGGK